MKTLHTLAFSLLLAATGAISATAPAATASAVMPATDHAWSPEEIATAAELAATRVPLLTYATPQGKAFFDRLTATDYNKTLSDAKVPLKIRVHQNAMMLAASGQLLVAYANATNRGQPVHAEAAAASVVDLGFAGMYAILGQQWFAGTNAKDPHVVSAKAQLETQFSSICRDLLKATLIPHFFTPSEVTYILRTISNDLKYMKVFFTPATRAGLRQQLTTQRPQYPAAADEQLIDAMLQTLAG